MSCPTFFRLPQPELIQLRTRDNNTLHTEPRAARLFLLVRFSPRPGERCRYPAKQVAMPDDNESDFRRALAASPLRGALNLLDRVEDPAAWSLLPDLFERVRSVTPTDTRSVVHYREIVRIGVAASMAILKNVGFDRSNPLHSSIWDWTVEVTESDNAPLAAATIYSLEKLGIPPYCVQDQLLKLMNMPAKSHPDSIGTCRAVAFRVLLRLNEQEAILHVGKPAFVELREMISSLRDIDVDLGKPADSPRMQEFEDELIWLNNAG